MIAAAAMIGRAVCAIPDTTASSLSWVAPPGLWKGVTPQLPERHHTEVKARWWKTFDQASSPAKTRRGPEAIIADYRAAYPSARGVIERDLDALLVHLRWPTKHHKRIQTTHLLERTFVEARRRTKIIARLPGETSALSLV